MNTWVAFFKFTFILLCIALVSITVFLSDVSKFSFHSDLRPSSLSSQLTSLSLLKTTKTSTQVKKFDFCDGGVSAHSGYIDIGDHHYFFYFFESRSNPAEDDVILWLNGGGASSSIGLFMELGPCSVVSENETKFNPYSWNSFANVLFLDQPVGVGFSYADSGNRFMTTEESAKDIAILVYTFFEIFSEFQGRTLHMAGESYAGRYIPVYASEILEQNLKLLDDGLTPINLKSIMIGNGATDFLHVPSSYYDILCTNVAAKPLLPVSVCMKMKQVLPKCEDWIDTACIDRYDKINCIAAFTYCMEELSGPFLSLGLNPYDMTQKCDDIKDCYPAQRFIQRFLDQYWVREALGVDVSMNFSLTNDKLSETFLLNGDALHQNDLYVAELLEQGVKTLIYAGTNDFTCNWVGNEKWTLNMHWSGQDAYRNQPLREWQVDGTIVGKVRTYGNLTFATIYGAGHLAPHDKPIESLEMVKRWLADDSL